MDGRDSKAQYDHPDRRSSERETSPISTGSTQDQDPPPYSAREPVQSSVLHENTDPTSMRIVQQTTPEVVSQPSTSTTAPTQPGHDKPIAIPAIDPAHESPFIRAYAPQLTEHKIPKDKFLAFLDQLNYVVTTSPPIQVLDATGGILKSVPILFPLHWIGNVVSGLANLGGRGISRSRSDSVLRHANRELFFPRGLKVEIGRLDALAHIARIPILDSKGKINRQAPLLRELHELGRGSVDEAQELDLQQRRMRLLQPWIAELELNVLPWTSQSRLTRFNAALKKRNSSRNQGAGEGGSEGDEDDGFRKCLWLIVRKVEGECTV